MGVQACARLRHVLLPGQHELLGRDHTYFQEHTFECEIIINNIYIKALEHGRAQELRVRAEQAQRAENAAAEKAKLAAEEARLEAEKVRLADVAEAEAARLTRQRRRSRTR